MSSELGKEREREREKEREREREIFFAFNERGIA